MGEGECVSDLKARALNATTRTLRTAMRDATVAEHCTPPAERDNRENAARVEPAVQRLSGP